MRKTPRDCVIDCTTQFSKSNCVFSKFKCKYVDAATKKQKTIKPKQKTNIAVVNILTYNTEAKSGHSGFLRGACA